MDLIVIVCQHTDFRPGNRVVKNLSHLLAPTLDR